MVAAIAGITLINIANDTNETILTRTITTSMILITLLMIPRMMTIIMISTKMTLITILTITIRADQINNSKKDHYYKNTHTNHHHNKTNHVNGVNSSYNSIRTLYWVALYYLVPRLSRKLTPTIKAIKL